MSRGKALATARILTDLALELVQRSAGFRRSLPASPLSSLATLVRAMNCYYSNLIEGHDAYPVDIERALQGDYSKDAKKRDLQLEAMAHIAVQQRIDEGGLRGRAVAADSIREIHRRFCEALPEDLLWVEDPARHERIRPIPGELRTRDVAVGDHIAISAPAVPRFLGRFEGVYSRLGKSETILAAPAAHHRLAWIHPFLDGNGRVARLMSHATLLEALDAGAPWQLPDGVARHRMESGGGSLESFQCGVKGKVAPGPDTLNGRANQHDPGACQPDECLDMSLFILKRYRTGIEEVMKQRGRPGRIPCQERNVADRFEHTSPRQKRRLRVRREESLRQVEARLAE